MEEFLRQMLSEIKQLQQGQENILSRLLSLENKTINSFSHIESEMDRLCQRLDAVCDQTAELLEFKTASVRKINVS